MSDSPAATDSTARNLDPLDPSFIEDPYPTFHAMRSESPVLYSESMDAWLVTGYREIGLVSRDHATYSSENALGFSEPTSYAPAVVTELEKGFWPRSKGMVERNQPEHTTYRSLVNRAFTPARVAALGDLIRSIADGYIDDLLASDAPVDFISTLGWPMPLRVVSEILGVDSSDLGVVRAFTDAFRLLATDMVHLPLEEQIGAARVYVEFQHYAAERIRERQATPRDDLLSALVGNDLPLKDQVSLVMHTLVAGHETTAGMLGNTLHLLLSERSRWEAALATPELVKGIIEESMRMEASVQLHRRKSTAPSTLSGVEVPDGADIVLFYGAASRDPQAFPDPDVFDPTRHNAARHHGFGKGIHTCAGSPLARLEGLIAFQQLLQRVPEIDLAPDDAPRRLPTYFLRGWEYLPVVASAARDPKAP